MTVSYAWEVIACAVYLIPVAVVLVFVLLSDRRDASPAELAFWIPAAVAFDALSSLAFARAIPFDLSLVLGRIAWVVAGGALIVKRRQRLRIPRFLDLRTGSTIVASGVLSALLSLYRSRDYPLWDRDLHIPTIPLLRAQRIPFLHVFQANTVFHYHFLGDGIAAALQTFSGARLHSSLTLSLAHDLMFGLVGICVAAWLCSLSARRLWIIPSVLAVFLIGPLSLQRPAPAERTVGFSCFSFWGLSYRPHVAPAALFLVGLFTAVFAYLRHQLPQRRMRLVGFFCLASALGVTDEASAGVFACALAITWLAFPEVLAQRRIHGLIILACTAAAILVANVGLAAAVAPGGPVQAIRVVAWRLPGLGGEFLPLFTAAGLRALAFDMAPLAALQLAVFGWAWRSGFARARVLATFLVIHGLLGAIALFVLDINGHPSESHRFVTGGQVLLAVAGLTVLATTRVGDWQRGLVWASFFLAATSAFFWAQNGVGGDVELSSRRLDCRQATGARLFDDPRPAYVPRAVWFTIAGCRPLFTPGTDSSWQTLQTSGPALGRAAFETLDRTFVSPTGGLDVACPPGFSDPACHAAQTRGACRPAGDEFVICRLSPSERRDVLNMPW